MLWNFKNMKKEIRKPLIIVVDDSKTIQLILKKKFEKIYNILTFSSSSQAENLIKEKAEEIDVILLDINLGEENGWDFCSRLKSDEATQNIAIIFISGNEKDEDIIKGIEIGGSDYLTKPFNLDILKVRIDNLIRMRSFQRKEIEFEKLELFKNITVTLSHEINNGLMAAFGSLNKIEKKLLLNNKDEFDQELKKITISLKRIQETVKSLNHVDLSDLTEYVEGVFMLDLTSKKL